MVMKKVSSFKFQVSRRRQSGYVAPRLPKWQRRTRSATSLIVLGGFFVFLASAQAAGLGEQVNFHVDSGYDASGRSQLTAELKVIGDYIYFYVEDDYWAQLNITQRGLLEEELRDLADEFDRVIYPKERAAFGSEWNPGIDNDKRITVLVSQLVKDAGGYFNTSDGYPQEQIPTSNQREMVYLNILNIFSQKNKALLAHEFQHLISFYQKTVLYDLEEEIWLNEARSEYAPTVCGYNDVYPGSYLADRVDAFLDSPSDSLTEWKNKVADYGVANLFLHYLVDHYGLEILTRMTLNHKTGIASINQALADLGYTETFADIFADWAVANYLNNCQISPENNYCYLNKNLTYQRLHTDYSASYSGFPNLIVSRSSSVKDWSPRWYRFRQGIIESTERDTLKLEFIGSTHRGDFYVPYIITDQTNQTTVQFIPLDSQQQGVAYIPDFTSLNKSVIMIPFNQYKKSGFGSSESLSSFSFTASSVAATLPVINELAPSKGSISGGLTLFIQGENLSLVNQIIFGQMSIIDFNIINDQTISFVSPAHPAGSVDIILTNADGEQTTLAKSFTYSGSYPEGSLIRAKGDYKVYIIKNNYRRWVQRAEIFNTYGHLRWENIIEISPEGLADYQEAWLIRADGDPRVYEVNADGTKHWLNMTAEEFTISGHLWGMVYIVNSFERDFYQTGAEVMFQ